MPMPSQYYMPAPKKRSKTSEESKEKKPKKLGLFKKINRIVDYTLKLLTRRVEDIDLAEKYNFSETTDGKEVCQKYLGFEALPLISKIDTSEFCINVMLRRTVEAGISKDLGKLGYYHKTHNYWDFLGDIEALTIEYHDRTEVIEHVYAALFTPESLPPFIITTTFAHNPQDREPIIVLNKDHESKLDDIKKYIAQLRRQFNPFRKCLSKMENQVWSIVKTPKLSKWSDLVPNIEVKNELEKCFDMLVNPDKYRDSGLMIKRGVILSGAPGVGKTAHLECLINMCIHVGVPVFLVSGQMQGTILNTVYQEALASGPSLVILEDIDTIAPSRDLGSQIAGLMGQPSVLNTLLNILDGQEKVDGVVTVATTNKPESIDRALGSRPGRFDRHFKFFYPDTIERIRILKLYLDKFEIRIDPQSLVDSEETAWFFRDEGVTPSFIRDAVSAIRLDALSGKTNDALESLKNSITHLKEMINVDETFNDPKQKQFNGFADIFNSKQFQELATQMSPLFGSPISY